MGATAVAQDPARELLDLVMVNRLYLGLLEKTLGHSVPVPAEVSAAGTDGASAGSVDVLKRWLKLLDLAITSPMVRDALKGGIEHESSAALLRYYLVKASQGDVDRDKSDLLAPHIFRNPPPGSSRGAAPAAEGHSDTAYSYVFSQKHAQEYEAEVLAMAPVSFPPLSEEHEQMLREFQYLHQEADDFRHFDQLMDSGILQRVRDLKSQFGAAFYHPRVLSTVAVYNVFFGRRFDDLFREAASQIEAFATKVQQEGGSIMSPVHGDVTVKHLADVEENNILTQEYGKAREHLHKISKFKKAVDTRKGA